MTGKSRLKKINQDEFEHVFSLMERSFPEDEYRSREEQKKLLFKQNYEIYGVCADWEDAADLSVKKSVLKQKEIRAFLAVWRFLELTFIEHFAVDPVFRSGGLGSMILAEAKRLFPTQICLEVELPNTELAKRRIAFYKRNGFYVNDYPYVQPPLSAGKQELPLLLMTSQGRGSQERFERIKKLLYREVYGVILTDFT